MYESRVGRRVANWRDGDTSLPIEPQRMRTSGVCTLLSVFRPHAKWTRAEFKASRRTNYTQEEITVLLSPRSGGHV